MQHTAVDSSNLESVGYESNSKILEVRFKNGSLYRYSEVPEGVYRGLLGAGSVGGYLDAYVKKAGYPFVRVI